MMARQTDAYVAEHNPYTAVTPRTRALFRDRSEMIGGLVTGAFRLQGPMGGALGFDSEGKTRFLI